MSHGTVCICALIARSHSVHIAIQIPYSREYKYQYLYVHFLREKVLGTYIRGVLLNGS